MSGPHPVPVPEGYLHRSHVLARPGWTSADVTRLLGAVEVRVEAPVTAAGVSNKAYPIAAVESAEATDPEVKRRAKIDARITLRRPGGYQAGECIDEDQLHDRGWTTSDISRYLAQPDAYDGHRSLWAVERAQRTEVDRPTVRQGQERAQAAREWGKERQIAAVHEAGATVYRRGSGDQWVLAGPGLTAGALVIVTRRDKTTRQEWVGDVLATSDDGIVTATIGRAPAPAVDEPAPRARLERPAGPAAREALLLGQVHPGQVIRMHGRWVCIDRSWRVLISDDDPTIWGSHLLGYEGHRGWRVLAHDTQPPRGADATTEGQP